MRALALTVPLIAAAMALTACGQAPQQPPAAVGWANQSTPIAPPAMLTFGQTHTWPDGDTVTIGQPRRQTGTSELSGRTGTFILTDVTVRNNGPVAKPANGYLLQATINDTAADTVIPIMFGIDVPKQEGDIAPGGALRFVAAFTVADSAPVRFQVQAQGEQFDPARPVVFFQGTV